ncbi:MAG: permease-like cell division protein FtsX [Bacteroidales bacterium]|nr:permease-like cell division protein FtsX [Candidatus Cryptobacteroides choladohippi]MCQ2179656.1 permease-like cell division protein FtsX [Bacteroidales bacterium]
MGNAEKKKLTRRLANAYLSSIISIALVLLLIGVACLVLVNARSASDYFKESMQISVLMREEVTESQATAYQTGLAGMPFVRSTHLVTREEGLRELQDMLGEDFLSVFETSPVPLSIDITLNAEYVSSDSLALILPQLNDPEIVDEVNCQQNLIDALNTNLKKISLVLGVLVLLLLFISFVLINNTVRLSVSARRFTVHTMQLVGATRRFIRRPFMRAALLQGLAASFLALLGLAGLLALLHKSFPRLFDVFTTQGLVAAGAVVVASGVAICLVSSYFVVNRMISLNKDDLYY